MNCIFTENTSGVYGGSIHATGYSKNKLSKITVEYCEFTNSSAQLGGGIDVNNHDVEIKSCAFNNNFAEVSSGVLSTANTFTLNYNKAKGIINIDNSSFSNNVSGNYQLSTEKILHCLVDLYYRVKVVELLVLVVMTYSIYVTPFSRIIVAQQVTEAQY